MSLIYTPSCGLHAPGLQPFAVSLALSKPSLHLPDTLGGWVIGIVRVVVIVMPQPGSLGSLRIVGEVSEVAARTGAIGKVHNGCPSSVAHLHKVLVESVLLAPVLETLLALAVTLLAVREVEAGQRSTHA